MEYTTLRYGSSGDEVKKLQQKLGISDDGIYGSQTQKAVENYQRQNGLQVDGIAGNETLGHMYGGNTSQAATQTAQPAQQATQTTPALPAYTQSAEVQQAKALLDQYLTQKPGSYQSQWQDEADAYLRQYQDRDPFSYDLSADARYQQYKDQYVQQGQLAMMDTMGRAAALTGGYGNTYGQQAGQQAYHGYLQQLNDVVPELYQQAYEQYEREGQNLLDMYGMYMDREALDYGRYQDDINRYYTELDRLTDDARYKAEQDYSKWATDQSFAYQQYRDQIADSQWQAQFDESKRQYDEQMALSKSKSSGGGSVVKPVTASLEQLDSMHKTLENLSRLGEYDKVEKRIDEWERNQIIDSDTADGLYIMYGIDPNANKGNFTGIYTPGRVSPGRVYHGE